MEFSDLTKLEDFYGNMSSVQCQELSAILKQRTQLCREESMVSINYQILHKN